MTPPGQYVRRLDGKGTDFASMGRHLQTASGPSRYRFRMSLEALAIMLEFEHKPKGLHL